MSARPKAALGLTQLEDRLTPATLDLTTQGAVGTFNGATFAQYDSRANVATDGRRHDRSPAGTRRAGTAGDSARLSAADCRRASADDGQLRTDVRSDVRRPGRLVRYGRLLR